METPFESMSLEQSEVVFNGYMQLKSMALKNADGTYQLSGRYEWTTRPQGFQSSTRRDVFTIAPDSAGYFNNNTLYAIRKVQYTKGVMDGLGNWTYTYGNENKEFNNMNDMDFISSGFGIEVPVYYSLNTTNRISNYHSYMGYISGKMIMREPNTSCNAKICVDYAQNLKTFSVGLSVSIPKSVSISITPADKYLIQEAALQFSLPNFIKIN